MLTTNNFDRLMYWVQTKLVEEGYNINILKLRLESKRLYLNGLIKDFEEPFNCTDQIVFNILTGEKKPNWLEGLINDIIFNCKLDELNQLVLEKSSLDYLDNYIENNFSDEIVEFELGLLQV